MQRWQLAADDRLGEERHLFLAFKTGFGLLRDRHFRRRGFDDDRFVQFDAALFLLDDDFALLRDFLTDLPVAPGIDPAVEEADAGLKEDAKFFEGPQPGHAGKNAPAGRHGRQQQQRRAGVAQLFGQHAAKFDTEQAARRQRQLRLQGIETQRLQRRTGQQQDEKTAQRDEQRMLLVLIRRVELAVAPPDEHAKQHDPPPGRQPEQVEHQVGDPGPGAAGRIVHGQRADGMRPARVFLAEAPQGHDQEQRDSADAQPARLLQQRADFFRQGAGGRPRHRPRTHPQTPGMTSRSSS